MKQVTLKCAQCGSKLNIVSDEKLKRYYDNSYDKARKTFCTKRHCKGRYRKPIKNHLIKTDTALGWCFEVEMTSYEKQIAKLGTILKAKTFSRHDPIPKLGKRF